MYRFDEVQEMYGKFQKITDEEISAKFATFNRLYSPEALRSVEGGDLIARIFGKSKQESRGLFSWIEHGKEPTDTKCGGGTGGQLGILYDEDNESITLYHYVGHQRTAERIDVSVEDALAYAQAIRAGILECCDIIQEAEMRTVDEYKAVYERIRQILSGKTKPNTSSWYWNDSGEICPFILKYFFCAFPNKFAATFTGSAIIKALKNIVADDEITSIPFVNNGRLSLYARSLGAHSINFEAFMYKNGFYGLRFWKMSHSGLTHFTKEELLNLEERRVIVMHSETGKKQGWRFMNEASEGDLFYLCYGSRVKLVGRIVSDEAAEYTGKNENGWYERQYEIVAMAKKSEPYVGAQKGWAPNYNSTFVNVKENERKEFEKLILKPYFGKTLSELCEMPALSQEKQKEENLEMENNIGKNTILYGPPGTGKTYNTVKYALAIIEKDKSLSELDSEDYNELLRRYNEYKAQNKIAFVTFHQSYSYEDFIEGIKPVICEQNGAKGIYYDVIPGVFKEFCKKADGAESNRVFIIDEINRGNISKIFGELITLIEPSKRKGAREEMTAVLPYSKDSFSVPDNVYIIGTMNTADRSIALIDTALRRRFDFVEKMPNADIYKDVVVEGVDIKRLMETINGRIYYLYDREHTVGHAYFMELLENKTLNTLKGILKNGVFPLLQEYFYDDYDKIAQTLNDVEKKVFFKEISPYGIETDGDVRYELDYEKIGRLTADEIKSIYEK